MELEANSILLIFNLPHPIRKFWWKKDPSMPKTESICQTDLPRILWGNFNRPLYQEMRSITKQATKSQIPLWLSRINSAADHNPEGYYYLWEVSTPRVCQRSPKYVQ